MRKKAFDWLHDCMFDEYEWLSIARLAKERGFPYPRAQQQPDGRYLFTSGLTLQQLWRLLEEVKAGGWTHLPGARKRHYFREQGSILENPSLCREHKLTFYTMLDHDFDDSTKCKHCLRGYKRMRLVRLVKE